MMLFASLFRDRLLPAPTVSVGVVLATSDKASAISNPVHTSSESAVDQLLFQASGWVEPDPYPVKATVLTDGIVAQVQVLEGQMVQKGELLATLVDDDAKLEVDAASSKFLAAVAALEVHKASIAVMENSKTAADAMVKAADTVVAEADDQARRLESLKAGAVSESDFTVARLRLERETANRQAAQARAHEARSELNRLHLETELKEAEVQQAKVSINQAQLKLQRMRIEAPISGRVLRLTAVPGERKMLGMDHPESSTIAILYSPEHLQVRVDVPLADAAGLVIGQAAKIHCSLLPEQVFTGMVTRINGEADLQRNTLQAKVRIDDASDLLRPEMLCRVEFFTLQLKDKTNSNQARASGNWALSTWVPETALVNGQVWVVDPDSGKASRRTIKPGNDRREGYRRVQEGLLPGEHVVLNPNDLALREGQRVSAVLSTKVSE